MAKNMLKTTRLAALISTKALTVLPPMSIGTFASSKPLEPATGLASSVLHAPTSSAS